MGSKRLDEAPAKRGTRGKRATRRAGHIHDDHLDVFTVAGDRTCPQPRVPLPISIVLSRVVTFSKWAPALLRGCDYAGSPF